MLAKRKRSSIEEIITKALANVEISHNEFTVVRNEEENYRRLKDSISTKDSQRGDIERNKLIKHGMHISVDEILKQNERRSLKLKTEIQNPLGI